MKNESKAATYQYFHQLGEKFKSEGRNADQIRESVRPLIQKESEKISDRKERQDFYVALWQQVWAGFNG